MRVNPKENHGNDIIPVIVDRKGPQTFRKGQYSADGMFATGDTTVFVHEFTSHRIEKAPTGNMRVVFGLPQLADDMRALPLKCFVGEGRSIGSYLEMLPSLDGSGKYLWGLDA